jgi:hypothetical protein
MDFELLLKEYRNIWNHRSLCSEENNSEQILKEAMKRELLDQNSHPRVRKNRYEKYYLSIHRLTNSSIPPETMLCLIQIYNELMEELSVS